jgi:four helix bundle protein
MKENKLVELSMNFSVDIIHLVKQLKSGHESIISNQIGRSGTSIGANIHEAQYAQGKKDFVSKLEIALKEASETGYWLELLYRTNYINEQTYKSLSSKCASLRVMLIASCKTAKKNVGK